MIGALSTKYEYGPFATLQSALSCWISTMRRRAASAAMRASCRSASSAASRSSPAAWMRPSITMSSVCIVSSWTFDTSPSWYACKASSLETRPS